MRFKNDKDFFDYRMKQLNLKLKEIAIKENIVNKKVK